MYGFHAGQCHRPHNNFSVTAVEELLSKWLITHPLKPFKLPGLCHYNYL